MEFVIIFVIISFLIIVPFLGIIQLQAKFKNQQMEYRLKTINKLSNAKSSGAVIQLKPEKQGSLLSGTSKVKILFYIFLPIIPLLMLLLSSSLYSAVVSILFYFGVIFLFYYLIVSMRRRRYHKSFIQELPNTIDLLIRSMRAGRTIMDSIRTVANDTQGPVAEQFRNIVDQSDLGKDFILVLNDVSRRINIPEFSFFVIVLSVQQETGGNVIKTMSSLANMLRQRQLMRMKVKALSAEGIVSALFMGSLPIFLALVILLIRPEYMMILFTNPTGKHILIYGIVSEIIGCLVISRMVQIDV